MNLPQGAKLVRNVALPATEIHFQKMIERDSKIGDVRVGNRMVGTYQLHKYRKALPDIKRRRRCIDIGAQVGLWAMHEVQDFQHVECFEPVPLHRDCFMYNMEPLERWTLHPEALSNEPGRLQITMPEHTTGNAHVAVGEKKPGEERGPTVEVEARTLDSYHFTEVDFIKIDVEGWELPVLEGARETLLRCKPWMIVEQKGNDAKIFGQQRNGAVEFLLSLGYKIKWNYSGDHFMEFPE